MKILVLSNLYPPHYLGGYELHCQTVVEALRARGHTVEVLTSEHVVPSVTTPIPEPGVRRALKIHGLFGHPYVRIFQLRSLELHNNQTLVSTLWSVRPDLVYVWNFGGLSKSMLLTLQKAGVPLVYAVCDHWIARSERADVWLDWWNRKEPKFRQKLLRDFWMWSGHRDSCHQHAPTNPIKHLHFQSIYFCSRALRDFTADAGFNVRHGDVIYCPIDTQRFDGVARRANMPLEHLLYVGRLHPDKGVMTCLRAMSLIQKQFNGTLDIYGHGDADYEEVLHSFVQDHQLPVRFHPALPPHQMPEIYRGHDALIFPSEWPEPFALVPLEAMSTGLPVIGTTTGGSGELFRHGENALTYESGNADELAHRILELSSNNHLREHIAQAGQREVRARFAEHVIVDQVEAYLEQTLKTWAPLPLPDYAAA